MRRMSRLVGQAKLLEQLKNNDELCKTARSQGKFLLFFRGRLLWGETAGKDGPLWTLLSSIPKTLYVVEDSAVLVDTEINETPLFACPVSSELAGEELRGRFVDIRRSLFILGARDAELVSRGYSLLSWHEKMSFCPSCKSPLIRNVSGSVRYCSGDCSVKRQRHFYPPIAPVAITRVVDATGERALLVRQPQHPRGMFSCIAGFIESGESLESTVVREVAEETGVAVECIQYFGSQTWPLPQSSLMLGCTAIAMESDHELDVDHLELEDARWFTKEEVQGALDRVRENPGLLIQNEEKLLLVPPRGAIAFNLLSDWVKPLTKLSPYPV